MVGASATLVVSDDDVLLVAVNVERDAPELVDEDEGAGCRLTHVWVMSFCPRHLSARDDFSVRS